MDKKRIGCNKWLCKICDKNFSSTSNLRRHIKKTHPGVDVKVIAPPLSDLKFKKHYKFSCQYCHKNFNHKHHLTFHEKTHGTEIGEQMKVQEGKKCPLCKAYMNAFRKQMYTHFKTEHDITITIQNFEFNSLDEFKNWHTEIEKSTKSRFVKESGTKSIKDCTVANFVCHRSGFFSPKGRGLRNLKTRGSNKIGGFCPAGFKLTLFKPSTYIVEYVETHVGHENEVERLLLTPLERQSLASKIARNIPFDTILDEIRDSISESPTERLHLLKKKDLHNINNSINLNLLTSVKYKCDDASFESWVTEMRANGCVLFYKHQNEYFEEYSQLKQEDFLLIIMNGDQRDILKKYANDCIIIDRLDDCEFQLVTILVLDGLRQAVPCGFLISNRIDQDVLTIFFSHIKEHVGGIAAKIFMSDIADDVYVSWMEVMSPPMFRFYCSWHVDHDWRSHLKTISCKEKRAQIYKALRSLLQKNDTAKFQKLIERFEKDISIDPETQNFSNYMQQNYLKKTSLWANCYRTQCNLNKNMHIERMHRTLKLLFGKHVKQLNKAVHVLMEFVKDKFMGRLVEIHEEKICTNLADIRHSHKLSESLNMNLIVEKEGCWEIASSSKKDEIYVIKENVGDCGCQLICTDCAICFHRYSCSCLDSAVKWSMCKHIHLLCKYRIEKQQINEIADSDDGENVFFEECIIEETVVEHKELFSTNEITIDESNLLTKKEELKKTISGLIDEITEVDQLEVLERLVTAVVPNLPTLSGTNKSSQSNNNTQINTINFIPKLIYFK